MPTLTPEQFAFIRHWGEYIGLTEEEIVAQQEAAVAEDAPVDAVYNTKTFWPRPVAVPEGQEVNGGWRTIHDIGDEPSRRHFVERGLMTKGWKKKV